MGIVTLIYSECFLSTSNQAMPTYSNVLELGYDSNGMVWQEGVFFTTLDAILAGPELFPTILAPHLFKSQVPMIKQIQVFLKGLLWHLIF